MADETTKYEPGQKVMLPCGACGELIEQTVDDKAQTAIGSHVCNEETKHTYQHANLWARVAWLERQLQRFAENFNARLPPIEQRLGLNKKKKKKAPVAN